MIYQVWPTLFYVGKVKNHDKIVESFMPYILNEKEYFHEPWELAKCKSSCQHDNNKNMPWNIWHESIKDNFMEYMEGLKPYSPMKMDIVDSWANIYHKEGFQEMHDHGCPGVNFSCSYFLEIDREEGSGGELHFEDMNYTMASMAGLNVIFQQFDTKWFVPKIEPGTIVFFPSWVKHFTSPNLSNKRRTTFSANFNVEVNV